jgi:hypothetical protein
MCSCEPRGERAEVTYASIVFTVLESLPAQYESEVNLLHQIVLAAIIALLLGVIRSSE